MLLILSVCLALGAAAPQATSEEYYAEYEYYEDYAEGDVLPRNIDQAVIPVQEISQEPVDKTPIFVGGTKLKQKVPLVCVSCRSQGITKRPQQKIDNIIKGTQDEFGHDGRDKVKATPQNTKRAQVAISHALKSAQDALGEDGRNYVGIQPTRELTKVQSKGRVGISGTLKSAQDSFGEDGRYNIAKQPSKQLTKVQSNGRVGLSGSLKSSQDSLGQDGRDNFASIPARGYIKAPTRKRVGLSGGLRSAQSAQSSQNNDSTGKIQSQPRRGLTKIDPKRRLSILQADRASRGKVQPSEGKVQVTSKPRRALTRIQVGRTKITVRKDQESLGDDRKVKTQADSSERRLRQKPRTRVRMRDAAKLRREENQVKEKTIEATEQESQS